MGGPLAATGYYLAYNGIAANYIFINFAMGHTHLPTVLRDDLDTDWVRYAAKHTMNVDGAGGVVDWWMAFLNFQIEHHLFPQMPQFRHPRASPRVKALFEKHGVEYITKSYFQATGMCFKNLFTVGLAAASYLG